MSNLLGIRSDPAYSKMYIIFYIRMRVNTNKGLDADHLSSGDVVKIFTGIIFFIGKPLVSIIFLVNLLSQFFLGEPSVSIFFPGDLPNQFVFVIFTTPPK